MRLRVANYEEKLETIFISSSIPIFIDLLSKIEREKINSKNKKKVYFYH